MRKCCPERRRRDVAVRLVGLAARVTSREVITALIQKIAQEYDLDLHLDWHSATGGRGKAGVELPLGGVEFARDVVVNMDIGRVARKDKFFARFVAALRAALNLRRFSR